MIIRSSRKLKAFFHDLGPGDVFIGTVAHRHLKQTMFVDLLERGVTCLPSPLSQHLSNSKVAQALLLKQWMAPHTTAIARRVDLLHTINRYNQSNITAVITKEDRLHCGHGVRRWENIETLYSFIALSEGAYPFVIQPFLNDFNDVRVVIVGDFIEAYIRYNPDNFRMNISAGAKPKPFKLDDAQKQFCLSIMQRGKFPYAHMDLHILKNGNYYLSEIALNGGTKGVSISREELDQKKQNVLEGLADQALSSKL